MSSEQMMEFGYMFLNGNIDDFLNNKSISEDQKKMFLSMASSNRQYQEFLVKTATQNKISQMVGPESQDKLVSPIAHLSSETGKGTVEETNLHQSPPQRSQWRPQDRWGSEWKPP